MIIFTTFEDRQSKRTTANSSIVYGQLYDVFRAKSLKELSIVLFNSDILAAKYLLHAQADHSVNTSTNKHVQTTIYHMRRK